MLTTATFGAGALLAGMVPPSLAIGQFLAYHRREGLDHGLSAGDIVARLAHEMVAYARVASWHPRLLLEEGWREAPEDAPHPVLCFHGFTQNASNFVGIRRALAERGRRTAAFTLGFPGRRVAAYAPRMIAHLEEALSRHPEGIDVVAHSMGGVVLRVAMAERPDLARGLRRVVTLGTPHRGTASVRGPLWLAPEARDLSRRSGLLAELPSLGALLPAARVTTVAGDFDLVVYPRATCHDEATRNVVLPVGHAGLVALPRGIATVVQAIDDAV